MTDAPPTPPASPRFEGPPLVYISYSHVDEIWLNKILVWLKPMEAARQIRVFHDRTLKPGAEWDETLQSNLRNAALGIVLLSPDWLASEYPTKVEFPVLASRRLIPVLVRECAWQGRAEISRFMILMADGKPLSAVRRPKQEQAFRSLVKAVQSALGIPSGLNLSREAHEIHALAALLARSRPERDPIDAACLVYAFLERGQQEPTPVKTPRFLWDSIPDDGRSRYADLRQQRFPLFPAQEEAPVPDSPDDRIFGDAAALSSNTLAGGPIHARHLLAATLIDPDAAPLLAELGVGLVPFRDTFLEFVLKVFPEESREYWASFLATEAEPDEPVSEAPGVIASYQSEDWTGRDLLNVTRDVNALAALVAGWNVQPPLSIGLFAEWGSGKSFFMREMRKRVKRLAMAAQASGKPQRECAYYKNIAQIEFNAWHYMEGDNLWACLVEHIFSNLGLPQDTTAAQVEDRQKRILEQIGVSKSLEEQAAERRKALETKKVSAVRKATDARTELDAKKTALEQEQSALWERIKSELSYEAVGVLQSIPESAQLRDSAESIRKLGRDARTLSGRALLLWNLLRHDPQRRKILYWMLGGSAVMFVLLQLAHWAAPDVKLLLQPAIQWLVPIGSALAATAGRFRPVLSKIARVVSFFEEKNQEITEAVARAERAQQRQIARLEDDVRTLSQDIDQAVKEQQEHQDAIAKLEKELAATDASRLLAEFIRSRADADDYRKHLGMVALVRRDFERLSDFFRSQRSDEQVGKERRDNNTVNRIILYVDDLDRCPPQTVVNVLQAIHLLLAFPIFVVVVAVDSRWVSRSLERCYDWLVPETLPTSAKPTASNPAERTRSGPGATAHDYLEKIFQIPFWLAPMDSTACQFMIRGLTQAISQDQAKLREMIASAKQQQPSAHSAIVPAVAQGGTPVSPPPQAGSAEPTPPPAQPPSTQAVAFPVANEPREAEEIDLTPRQLDVEESEIKKIDELAVLIGRSPRVAKRFLNCYRLLKARMDEAELRRFLAGRFQGVMEVLAIIVGAPTISREVMDALSMDGSGRDGKSLIEQLTRNLAEGALSTSEGAEVVRLLAAASPDHLESLRSVVPLVSRFSFATHRDSTVKAPKRTQKKTRTAIA